MLLKVGPGAGNKFEIARGSQLFRRHAIKHDHVETGAAVVRKDLDRNHLTDTIELRYLRLVILRQMAREWAKLVGLKQNQRLLGLLVALQVVHSLLHRADEAKDEQCHGRTADRDDRAGPMSPQC